MERTTFIFLSARQLSADEDIGMLWLPPQQTTASSSPGSKRVTAPVVISSSESSDDDQRTPDLSETEDDGFGTDDDYCHPYCRCRKVQNTERMITDDGVYWEEKNKGTNLSPLVAMSPLKKNHQ